jgi:hypothetical protein
MFWFFLKWASADTGAKRYAQVVYSSSSQTLLAFHFMAKEFYHIKHIIVESRFSVTFCEAELRFLLLFLEKEEHS